jgi:predicted transcriptional regulator
METKVVTAHIPVALAENIDVMAKRLERSKAWIIKQALTAWVDLEEEKHRLTLEAMSDIDNGKVVDHQSVLAWAASLDKDEPLPLPQSK